MGRIADFKCGYDNASGFGTWAGEEYGILFPQAYKEADMMRKLALAVKEHERAVCSSLEEAMEYSAAVERLLFVVFDGKM